MNAHSLRKLSWFALFVLPCWAVAQQPVPPQAAKAPALTTDEAAMIEIIAGFYRRAGARVPGQTATMADTITNWSREVRTIQVEVGRKRDPAIEVPGRLPPLKPVYEVRRYTRLHFGPFTGNDADTNAEYNPETELLTINSSLVGRLRPDRELLPNGESAVRQLTLRIEYAQTLLHEVIHSGQGADAGSPVNEALAYRGALQTTGAWLESFERNYAEARTKENARYVWAASTVYLEYLNTIRGTIVPQGTATADAIPPDADARVAAVTALRDRAMQEHRAIEILEQMAGPAVIPGTQRTLDEMLLGLAAHDLKELDQRVAKAARDAVDTGAGDLRGAAANYTSTQKDEKAAELVRGAIPLLRNEWRRKVNLAAAAARKLEAFQPVLRFVPEEGVIDPQKGTAKLTVDVENDAEFARLLDALGRALQAATGDPAKLTVVDNWSATDTPAVPQVWRSGLSKVFDFPKTQDYLVELRRLVYTRVEIASPRIPKRIDLSSQDLFIIKPPAVPTADDLAGVWTGALTITEMPMLDGAAGAPSADACQFIDVSQLRQVQGKPFTLRAVFQPQSEAAGIMVLSVQPPEGIKAEANEPQRLAYRYDVGALTISVEPQPGIRLVMKATFVGNADRWTFAGAWSVADNTKNQNVKAIGGVWSGSKAVK